MLLDPVEVQYSSGQLHTEQYSTSTGSSGIVTHSSGCILHDRSVPGVVRV